MSAEWTNNEEDVVAYFAPLSKPRPDHKLVAQCDEDVAQYRRQRPPADVEEITWLLEIENRAIAEFVRWKMAIAVTDLDQMLIAQTALVICMAYERALNQPVGESERPADGKSTLSSVPSAVINTSNPSNA